MLAVAVWAPLVPVGFGIADEGWLLSAIDRLVDGQRLYADVYRSYGPGLYWTFEGLFRVFETSTLSVRWVWLGGLVLLSAGSFWLARPWLPLWAAAAVGLVPIFLRPPAHKTFVPLAYLGVLWLCRGVAERHGRPLRFVTLLALGAGFGLLALFRQEASAFGMLIAWGTAASNPVREGRSALGHTLWAAWSLGLGAALVWLPVLGVFAATGALFDAAEQLVFAGARGNAAMSIPFPEWSRVLTGPERLRTSLFFLPGIVAALGFLVSWRWLRSPERRTAGLILAQCSAMAVLAYGIFASRSDFPHLLQALVPAALVWAACVAEGFRATPASRVLAAGLALWLIAGTALLSNVPDYYARRARAVPMPVPGGEVLVSPEEARVLGELVAAVHREVPPGQPILALPYIPGLYHLADRPNASRHDAVLPGYATEAIQSEVIEAVDRDRVPLLVIYARAMDGRHQRTLGKSAPTLTAHLRRRYEPIERIGGFRLLRWREPTR